MIIFNKVLKSNFPYGYYTYFNVKSCCFRLILEQTNIWHAYCSQCWTVNFTNLKWNKHLHGIFISVQSLVCYCTNLIRCSGVFWATTVSCNKMRTKCRCFDHICIVKSEWTAGFKASLLRYLCLFQVSVIITTYSFWWGKYLRNKKT